MIRLAADEDLDNHIVRALRHRLPNVDIVRVQEAELAGIADEHVLAWTAETERVLVSHDASTMTAAAFARIEDGAPMPGVIVVPQWLSIGEALEDLVLVVECGEAEDCISGNWSSTGRCVGPSCCSDEQCPAAPPGYPPVFCAESGQCYVSCQSDSDCPAGGFSCRNVNLSPGAPRQLGCD